MFEIDGWEALQELYAGRGQPPRARPPCAWCRRDERGADGSRAAGPDPLLIVEAVADVAEDVVHLGADDAQDDDDHD